MPQAINVTAAGQAGTPATDPLLAAFLRSAVASDIVDVNVSISNDAPAVFAVGRTVVRFSARDWSNNTATATSAVTVVPWATDPEPPRDSTPPSNLTDLVATSRANAVMLRWRPPADDDFRLVRIVRSVGNTGSKIVYRGSETKFVDTSVRRGRNYRYVVQAVDRAGNKASGAAVRANVPIASLRSPREGVSLAAPPILLWTKHPRATYYNVQLWRGTSKILSRWPVRARLALSETRTYDGSREHLRPGVYRWYVWPGFGSKSLGRYGGLIGERAFRVVE